MSKRRTWAFVPSFALCALSAFAQEGRIHGTVHDATGAAVPGVTLTITNQATNATRTVAAGADGSYSASLPPGTYSVTAAFKGFARQTQKDLNVEAGATRTVDFTLQTQREEQVTVTALKRESTVQETPFSLAAPTEADLRRVESTT